MRYAFYAILTFLLNLIMLRYQYNVLFYYNKLDADIIIFTRWVAVIGHWTIGILRNYISKNVNRFKSLDCWWLHIIAMYITSILYINNHLRSSLSSLQHTPYSLVVPHQHDLVVSQFLYRHSHSVLIWMRRCFIIIIYWLFLFSFTLLYG